MQRRRGGGTELDLHCPRLSLHPNLWDQDLMTHYLVGWGWEMICHIGICLGEHLVNILQITTLARMQRSAILPFCNFSADQSCTSSLQSTPQVHTTGSIWRSRSIIPSCFPTLHGFTLFFAQPEALNVIVQPPL